MRSSDLTVQPQKQLTYSQILEARLEQALALSELFDPKKSSQLTWDKKLGATHARGSVPIDGKDTRIDIVFSSHDSGIVNIEFAVGDQFKVTGRGGVAEVFATVIEAVKQFVTDHPKITTLTFTASEQSRARMYDTLAKRVSKQLGWHVVPYDEMVSDTRLQSILGHGDFTFAIEKGEAPEHRQAAQRPQHGEFTPIFYVYAFENPDLPVIKIRAKKAMAAERFVIKNVPGYNKEHPMSVFALKAPPNGRTDVEDMGEVPPPPPKVEPPRSTLGDLLRKKLGV